MRPATSCRPVRLVPFSAALSGLRTAEVRAVPPKSAWFVCISFFAPEQALGALSGDRVGAAVVDIGGCIEFAILKPEWLPSRLISHRHRPRPELQPAHELQVDR